MSRRLTRRAKKAQDEKARDEALANCERAKEAHAEALANYDRYEQQVWSSVRAGATWGTLLAACEEADEDARAAFQRCREAAAARDGYLVKLLSGDETWQRLNAKREEARAAEDEALKRYIEVRGDDDEDEDEE